MRGFGRRGLSLLFLLLTPFCHLSAADDPVFNHPVTPSSKSDLIEVLSDLSDAEVMKGRFVQTKAVTRIGREFESRGEFVFSGSHGIIWDVQAPFPSLLILMEESMIQRNPEGKTTVIDAAENPIFLNFASAILAVFSGDFHRLERHYGIFFNSEGGKSSIGLIPSDQNVAQVIDSLVLSATEGLDSLVMYEVTGDSVRYQFIIDETRDKLRNDEESLFSY